LNKFLKKNVKNEREKKKKEREKNREKVKSRKGLLNVGIKIFPSSLISQYLCKT